MPQLGELLLYVALLVAAYIPCAALIAVKTRQAKLLESARRGIDILFITLTAASGILIYLLVTKDYTVSYVWQYTSLHLPAIYSAAAMWAGNAGSLLLWVWLLSVYAFFAVNIGWRRNMPYMPVVVSVLGLISLFFVALILLVPHSNPFTRAEGTLDPNGYGLNPQLENPFMVIHPPCLYLGYVGLAIPFAFAMAALVTRRLDSTWIRSTRRWTLAGWFFLSVGNILGAWWAYVTLGWGGYWAWDPVENAAFMPWLLGTAYIHSVIIQETKGMLRIWNMVLVILMFLMTVFGTFLTRSGILQSVHAFAQSPAFMYSFLWFMCVTAIISFGLLLSRLKDLKSEAQMESLLSRESAFLFNNVLLVAITFTVLWGTMFPLISEVVRNVKVSVGPPFFNQVISPMWVFFLILMGAGPLISWRKATVSNFKRNLLGPILSGIAGGLILATFGVQNVWALIFLSICVFVTATILLEFFRGTKVRAAMTNKPVPVAAVQLVGRQKRRYGGYIVHFGVVVLVVGVVLSSLFPKEQEVSLHLNESFEMAPYTITYEDFEVLDETHKLVFKSMLRVDDGSTSRLIGVERDYFPEVRNQSLEWWSRARIETNWKHDLYVTMPDFDKAPFIQGGDPSQPPAVILLHARVLPGVVWIWIGGYILALGTVICLWPDAVPVHLRGQVRIPSRSAPARG